MKNKRQRLLIFTDSRGQHKPAGSNHKIFAERLEDNINFDVEKYLCPMKWTTTLDFIEQFPLDRLSQYDYIILYTGIVDWSPRSIMGAMHDVYDNQLPINVGNVDIDTTDYSKKIVNNKKLIFDKVFGSKAMMDYLSNHFDERYEGKATINMYGLDMAEKNLLPLLAKIPNLIFINSNYIVPEWEGDYRRGRPQNIAITHLYSDLFAKKLTEEGVRLIDLREWLPEEVKIYTCDNMHLSKAGSDFIYEKIIELINMDSISTTVNVSGDPAKYNFKNFKAIERITSYKRKALLSSVNPNYPYLATLIIGIRVNSANPNRLENLKFLLEWIDYYYGDLFDVLLVEQDSVQKINLFALGAKPYVRHEFIFNPNEYNRGWGYNVAILHHCPQSKVVVLMDTDVLTGSNFVRDIVDCHEKIDVASPYSNIYYADIQESITVMEKKSLLHLVEPQKIKNPVTLSGGIVIWNRSAYLSINGFEQYVGYSCEDRAMDVTIYNHIDSNKIRISPEVYVHLYHPSDPQERKRFKDIYKHLTTEYGCTYDSNILPHEFIHKNCMHVDKYKTQELILARSNDFGDPDLYADGNELAVNGVRAISIYKKEFKDIVVKNNKSLMPAINKKINLRDFDGAIFLCNKAIYVYKNMLSMEGLFKSKLIEIDKAARKKSLSIDKISDTLVILGNGPSLKNVDFDVLKDYDTFALNSFYRYFEELDFYPTYFGCFDNLVTTNHRQAFQNLLLNKNIPIKKFFFLQNFDDPFDKLFSINVSNKILAKWKDNKGVSKSLADFWIYENSGASAMHAGIAMGYQKIILLGVDCSYIQVIDGAVQHNEKSNELLIKEAPKVNPNYWRDDYQIVGDVYHVPDAQTFQKPEWERLARNLFADSEAVKVEVYNCSPTSTLACFQKSLLKDVLPLNSSRLLNSTTFLIKSFGRSPDIIRLVESIHHQYGKCKIEIFDDSGLISEFDQNLIRSLGCSLNISGYIDVGLSAGRNYLIDNCETKYMVLLDEDFVFTNRTNIFKALEILASSTIDIVGGEVFDVGLNASAHNQPRRFSGDLILEGGVLMIKSHPINLRLSIEGYPLTDLVLNFFVAKTASIKKVRWDPELKLAEHLDFFLRAKYAKLNITYDRNLQVKHVQDHSSNGKWYSEMRNRADYFNKIFRDKYSITKIIKDDQPIKG